ncbi:MAG: LytTR family transcriptional regulator [Eubacterium sp.]|nr:LytTR family transcriptional regulator [Eubacterium sp.]MDD7208470.1 LytTR family DNA-binding domain-containing protein [Lachnospiraceae bacterium]
MIQIFGKESLYNYIIYDGSRNKENCLVRISPDMVLVEVSCLSDLKKLREVRLKYPYALLLIIARKEISPDKYLIPGISPDMVIVKPYSRQKACKSLQKFVTYFYEKRAGGNERFAVRTEGETYYFFYREIEFFEARERRLILHRAQQEILFNGSIRKLEEKLPPYFVRCHRSYIVNTFFIKKTDLSHGLLYINELTVIPVSKKYKARMEKSLKNMEIV